MKKIDKNISFCSYIHKYFINYLYINNNKNKIYT